MTKFKNFLRRLWPFGRKRGVNIDDINEILDPGRHAQSTITRRVIFRKRVGGPSFNPGPEQTPLQPPAPWPRDLSPCGCDICWQAAQDQARAELISQAGLPPEVLEPSVGYGDPSAVELEVPDQAPSFEPTIEAPAFEPAPSPSFDAPSSDAPSTDSLA
jgi:hypothetical protein